MINASVHVETYSASLNKKREELCGDKVEVKRNENSCIMVLADGLGSGVKANILATLTSTIISEMMVEGATLNDAVETITSTLPSCLERGVAYSTFTILQVFYDGNAYLVEFDNPDTIILRENQALSIKREIRVIGNRTLKESSFTVNPNDLIVMFSDGIIHAGLGQILNFGWQHEEVIDHLIQYTKPTDSAQEVSRILLATVNDLYGGKPGDDSTVAVAKILPALETRVMVGPPISAQDDELVVYRLLEANGKKIVCGGTTANIVSRVTSQEIRMDNLISLVSDVPPMAYINGIDLVTEGVLTLQKANEYIQECRKNRDYYDQFMSTDGKDGAFKLVKMLLLECTAICFMVGRSDNPAHKAIAYSTISLNNKIHLIEKMAADLKALGKVVSIELY